MKILKKEAWNEFSHVKVGLDKNFSNVKKNVVFRTFNVNKNVVFHIFIDIRLIYPFSIPKN